MTCALRLVVNLGALLAEFRGFLGHALFQGLDLARALLGGVFAHVLR